jgi:proline racemase
MVEVNEPFTEFKLDTPAGLISIKAEVRNGKAINVTFENVPAFSVYSNKSIYVPEIGEVKVDVAYGGMFYVILDSEELGLKLTPDNGGKIVRNAEMVKAIASEKLPVVHPENKDISGITIAVVSGPPDNPDATLKNAVVVSTGRLDWDRPETWKGVIDRSPCGTGTCAKMASLFENKKLDLETDFIHEGILGTTFTGRLVKKTKVGNYDAVVPTITGRAWITGFAQYVLDDSDPFPEGYTIGDIWGGN